MSDIPGITDRALDMAAERDRRMVRIAEADGIPHWWRRIVTRSSRARCRCRLADGFRALGYTGSRPCIEWSDPPPVSRKVQR